MKSYTRTVLVADDGKVLTDGNTFAKAAYLAEGADPSAWREVKENDVVEGENGY